MIADWEVLNASLELGGDLLLEERDCLLLTGLVLTMQDVIAVVPLSPGELVELLEQSLEPPGAT